MVSSVLWVTKSNMKETKDDSIKYKHFLFQIKYLQGRDSGMYECQVSTQPVRSFFVRLNILGEPDILIKQKT